MGTPHLHAWGGALALLVAAMLWACTDAPPGPRLRIGTGKSGALKGDEKQGKGKGRADDAELETDEAEGDDGELETDDDGEGGGKPPAAPVFPLLRYKTYNGQTTCDGDTYRTESATDAQLSSAKLDIATTKAYIACGGSCEKRANEKLQKSAIGVTSYRRVSDPELKMLAKQGYDVQPSLIYAHGVTKKDGTVFTFDTPVPVYAFPVAKGAYTTYKNVDHNWTTTVRANGQAFQLIVRATVKSMEGNTVVFNLENNIPGDTNGAFYEMFPSPRMQEYTIDTSTRTVMHLQSAHNWYGDENCDRNSEWTILYYKLCAKEKAGEVETFPCQ